MGQKIIRLAVFGSRQINVDAAIEMLIEFIKVNNPQHIITAGEPRGVCALARDTAKELSIPLTLHWLDRRHAAGCWEWRSRMVLMDCDHCLFLHNGISKGTLNEICEAEKLHRRYTYMEVK